jgi:hypothetical protein
VSCFPCGCPAHNWDSDNAMKPGNLQNFWRHFLHSVFLHSFIRLVGKLASRNTSFWCFDISSTIRWKQSFESEIKQKYFHLHILKNVLAYFVYRWRCCCKFGRHRIGSRFVYFVLIPLKIIVLQKLNMYFIWLGSTFPINHLPQPNRKWDIAIIFNIPYQA